MSTSTRGRPAGTVSGLFLKPDRGVPMEAVGVGTARRGLGFVGDCHASPLGPRQVLIVREEELDGLGVAPWQVRANIALRGLSAEDVASGRLLRFARGAQVRITHECEVCKVLRQYVPQEVFANLPGRRGSLGVIVRGGEIALGDRATISRIRYSEVPERIYDRLAWVIARVPRGRVVTYDTLIELVGASRPYVRVFPTYLKRARANRLPAHRVLTSTATLTGHLGEQARALRREGVRVDSEGRLYDPARRWEGRSLYLSR